MNATPKALAYYATDLVSAKNVLLNGPRGVLFKTFYGCSQFRSSLANKY